MNISELEGQLRNIVNSPRKQHALLQDNATWHMLCSCLDVIGDTELCLDAFLSERLPDTHEGIKYLAVYGALQALFVQQDAAENLAQALNVPYTADPLVKEIREIRNDSVGHPTKRGGGTGRAYNHIGRHSLSQHGFQLMTTYADGSSYQFKHVSIPDLISRQREILAGLLTGIIDILRREEMEHRAKFADKKLAEIFPPTTGYHIEKVFEGISRPEYAELGLINVRFIQEVIDNFVEELKRRGLDGAYDGVNYTLELLEYPLQELAGYFQGETATTLNKKSAYIFAHFVRSELRALEKMAVELDEEYSKAEV